MSDGRRLLSGVVRKPKTGREEFKTKMEKEITVKSKNRQSLIASLIGMSLVATAATSSADMIELGLGTVYTGTAPTSSTTPWLTATLVDSGLNTVNLTLQAPNLTGTEAVKNWLFNLNPSLDPSALSISVLNASGVTLNSVNTVNEHAGGGLLFDFGFDFQTANNDPGRFTQGDQMVFQISSAGPLSVADFNYQSSKDSFGPFTTAAHIISIPTGEGSGWIGDGVPVPEPATVIAGCLLLGILALRERSKLQLAFSKLTR